MNCPICNGSSRSVFVKYGFTILKCLNCNHYFTDLQLNEVDIKKIYANDYFFGGGLGYPDYTLEKNLLIKHGEYYARKIQKFIKSGTVLDIGSAAGFILKGFENYGWNAVGIEPNLSMVEYGKKKLGLNIQHGTIETFKSEMQFDLVLSIQVIACFYDIEKAMRNINEVLKPGGYILIETYNTKSLTAKLFGRYWHEYSPPSVLNYFNKYSLDYLMTRFNFHKVDFGQSIKKIISDHAKSLLKKKLSEVPLIKVFSGFLNVIPNNKILPYPGDDLFWALYQKRE
jgi:SAM-dependent methyltransferase